MPTKNRSSRGMVELSVLLMLLTIVISAAAALISAVGMLSNYQMKLAYAAQSGAIVYMNTSQWQGFARPGVTTAQVNTIVQKAVQATATKMGLGTVTATPSIVVNPNGDGVSYVKVKVQADSLTLLTFGGLIPATLSGFSQTVTFPFGNTSPISAAFLAADNNPPNGYVSGPGGVVVPAYGGSVAYDPGVVSDSLSGPLSNDFEYHEYFARDGGFRPL